MDLESFKMWCDRKICEERDRWNDLPEFVRSNEWAMDKHNGRISALTVLKEHSMNYGDGWHNGFMSIIAELVEQVGIEVEE
jgi:hypothetical protein